MLSFKLGGLNLRFRVLWQLVQVSSNPQLQPSFFVEQIDRHCCLSKALFGLVEEAGIKGAQRRMFWLAFIDRYIKALKPDLSGTPPLRKLADDRITELKE